MKFSHLARTFQEWGWHIKHEHYVGFSDYLRDMLKRNRVMIIENSGQIEAIVTYYLTDDYQTIYKKGTWEVAQDDENGSQVYIDKMVARKFTKQLWHAIHDAITEKYPNVETAIYHRAPADRCIKIRRRIHV